MGLVNITRRCCAAAFNTLSRGRCALACARPPMPAWRPPGRANPMPMAHVHAYLSTALSPALLCAAPCSQMPLGGPCACPTCPESHKHRSLGQWTYVPKGFKLAHPELELTRNACVNKRAECREWCGLKEQATPGRPSNAKKAKLNEPAVAVAVSNAESLPYPRKLVSIDEIWGVCRERTCPSRWADRAGGGGVLSRWRVGRWR